MIEGQILNDERVRGRYQTLQLVIEIRCSEQTLLVYDFHEDVK